MNTAKAPSAYTEFHPRWYRKRVSTWWWLGSGPYLRVILRELSSIFVALSVAMTLAQLWALRFGADAYSRFQESMRSPWLMALGVLTLAFTVFHSITWFNLAPRALTVRIGGRRVPEIMIALPNFIGWAAVSALIAWLVVRG